VSVVVVSYNTRDWLLRCLGSLPEASSHELDVVVVDNASADGSADAVAETFPTVRLVRNADNAGFARAVNQGAALARGDRLLLLNPDGYLEPGAVDALVAFADAHPEYVICGGRTVTPAGELDPRSCWGAPTLWSLLCSALMLSTLRPGSRVFDPEALGGFRRDRPRPVDIVTGCLLLVSTADWTDLGGFDERYFVYGEDADLCLRAAATTGRRCAITPDAVMVHAVGASSATPPDKRELLLRGRITVVRTHLGRGRGRLGGALIVAGVLARATLERAGAGRDAGWGEVWRRRRRWWRGYPPAATATATDNGNGNGEVTGRTSLRSGTARQLRFVRSILDPRSLAHAVRLLHYFHYTHVGETAKLTRGPEVRYAPNVSFANAERISIGARSRVGARCSLWAGDHGGAIRIGSDCNFAPHCFLTASNYGIEAGTPFLDQPKHDADIEIGDDVWLGTGVIVLAGVTIGSGTVVAAGSVVTRDLPPGVVAGGVPAKALRER
jgi:GT2 family glycosyltransferase/acetyltransferase-like isoleucine patch superfamily enzyme